MVTVFNAEHTTSKMTVGWEKELEQQKEEQLF
jgi:hypothetical protein